MCGGKLWELYSHRFLLDIDAQSSLPCFSSGGSAGQGEINVRCYPKRPKGHSRVKVTEDSNIPLHYLY